MSWFLVGWGVTVLVLLAVRHLLKAAIRRSRERRDRAERLEELACDLAVMSPAARCSLLEHLFHENIISAREFLHIAECVDVAGISVEPPYVRVPLILEGGHRMDRIDIDGGEFHFIVEPGAEPPEYFADDRRPFYDSLAWGEIVVIDHAHRTVQLLEADDHAVRRAILEVPKAVDMGVLQIGQVLEGSWPGSSHLPRGKGSSHARGHCDECRYIFCTGDGGVDLRDGWITWAPGPTEPS